ncbi:hypothetical protein HYE67_006294 [Fusarium culmorum]|uniref:Sulfite efflux pump SSU1 n=1 Tax=Fusarium culmorum TaxID=5516 RepID=A0A2T4GCZ5_FUSCU|nr:Sulfite efflux pump SSU1 [Fusarium culmorum]QPC64063.1 hypothetical protein HYE67_006294 [Fusarium culmorum]
MSGCNSTTSTGTVQAACNGSTPKPCEPNLPCKEETGWRRVIRNFTPSWFAVNMGTGIVSILLHNLPYNAIWVQYISYIFFGLNVVLFTVFTVFSIARYTLYPTIWSAMISHPGQSLFLGCFPMGLATIINMMVFSCKHWGDWVIYLAWSLWWFDVWVSVATCVSMPFIVMHRHRPGLENITAALLLPIVPAVVAAATGGIVAEELPNHHHALTTVIASYVLWGIGESFSAIVLALYFHRLTIHSIPPKEVIVSVFLPIGPLGQGGFGIQQLGKVAMHVVPKTNAFGEVAVRAGDMLYVLGVFFGIVMWGFALVWLSFALISIAMMPNVPRNLGAWGYTFPLGVLATCSNALAENLDSDFFKIATMIISLAVVVLWVVVAARTLKLAITGEMFHAPCLKDLREKSQAAGSDRRV